MTQDAPTTPTAPSKGTVKLPRALTVRELADILHATVVDVIKELMKRGIMAAINQSLDYEVASGVAEAMGYSVEVEEGGAPAAEAEAAVEGEIVEAEDPSKLKPRPPVVVVMGHVDHGKTSLLDAIRSTKVAEGEFGAITQHIGAYQVEVNGHKITFIDTPGHEAFTQLRARGASVTDIAVLVVAADDGVMPQTLEAINHAKAAGVPMIVAINKTDLPAANPEKVKQDLTQHNVVIEEYGGDVIAVPVSAKTKEGLDNLLEQILLVSEVTVDPKANPDRPAEGVIIEAEKDANRGPMATLIVQQGTLRVGDIITGGPSWGKIKAMFDDRGGKVTAAGPGDPVEVMGLSTVPQSGDVFHTVADEKEARDAAEARSREASDATRAVTLESISGDIAAGRVKDLNIIIKGDTHGSMEAIRQSLETMGAADVRVNIVHASAGNVSESDIMLATASRAIVVGFNVKIDPGARKVAETERVDIRSYNIIYELIEDVEKAVKGLMAPVFAEIIDGHAEVRALFRVRGGRIAGCMVTDGLVRRNSLARVMRGGEMIHESRVSSLRRFTDDVREVTNGLECGIGVEKFETFVEGDVIEAFHTEQRG